MKNKRRKEFMYDLRKDVRGVPMIEEPEMYREDQNYVRSRAALQRRRERELKRNVTKGSLAAGMLALGIGVAVAGCQTHNKEENNYKKPAMESETENKNYEPMEQEQQEENRFDTSEDTIRFIKNLYLEGREQIMGESDLTTADITVHCATYASNPFINTATGEYITGGDFPAVTEEKLIKDGISYERKEGDIRIYTVKNKEGKVIDCVTVEKEIPRKVIIGDQYEEAYQSVLVEMGTAIPKGLDYIDYLGTGSDMDIIISKREFLKAVEEYENRREEVEMDDGFEH